MTTATSNNPGLAALTAGTWTVDSSHSTIGFVARHLMVAKVRGQFTEYAGTVTVARTRSSPRSRPSYRSPRSPPTTRAATAT